MALIQIATPFNIDIEFETAEFYKRLFAYLVDLFLLISYWASVSYFFLENVHIHEGSIGFLIIILIIPMLFYSFTTELLLDGQTLGKKIFKIKVLSLNGEEPTLGQYATRWFMRFYEWGFILFMVFWRNFGSGLIALIPGGLCCIIIISTTKKKQRLGDIIAGTSVVNTKSKLTVHDTIFMNIPQQDYHVKFPQALRLNDRDINTIKNVLTQTQKNNDYEICNRVAFRVKEVLKISDDMYSIDFLEKIISDYNYLATKE